MPKVIAMLPTYNEALNIRPLVEEILAQSPEMEALVVDDDSPDGTWRIVEEMTRANGRVHLLHRTTARGRGLAGIAGFREALRLGADWILEMDADYSHHPRFIPSFLTASNKADIVVGSRLVAGGGETGRSPVRRLITSLASLFIRTVLGLRLKDPTSGYRLFSRKVMEAMPWSAMRATGPEVVQEILVAAKLRGFTLVEIPILFEERRAGRSTFNWKIMARSLIAVLRLRFFAGRLAPK